MKMWFKGSCFFRNFPHWGVCSAMLGPCQGCPVWRQLCRRCHVAAVAPRGRSKATSLTGDKTAVHQLPCWHRNSPHNLPMLLFDPGMPGVG